MYVEEVIAYVSGAVVKSILPKIKCSICINELTVREGDQAPSSLQVRKSYGALTSASPDVIQICRTAEKNHVRRTICFSAVYLTPRLN
ncbi:unnamed protein product [Trichogramma brassicae]|uniref:Uncharacterized protein n=1 Tax=Trichogramma brassicae TaxID=86971 RepID=A0A6H5J5H3_9HYME|nr:unnamed protein product [Trichogramma brassicae]